MDKYTVDIDKILNDLEYSELTDHNDAVHDSNLDKSYAGASANQKVKQTNTKHSITNVFHSLNEYLKTDISTKSKVLEENVSVRNESQNHVESYNNDTAYQKNDAGVSNNQSFLDFDTNKTIKDLQFIVERNNERSNESLVIEQSESSSLEQSEANIDMCIETNHQEELNENCLEVNNTNNELPLDKITEANKENESQEVCSESKEVSESTNTEEEVNIELDDSENEEIEFTCENADDCARKGDNNLDIIGDFVRNEPSNPSKLETSDSGVEIKDEASELNTNICEPQQLETNNPTERDEIKNLLETSETRTIEENPPVSSQTAEILIEPKPISFDMIHVDDSELDRCLEEIESECEIEKAELEKEEAIEAVEKEEDCGAIKSEEEITTAEEKTETNGERPTTLELENGDSKREIDLIGNIINFTFFCFNSFFSLLGSPGSTPYNNVYINKEPSSESDFSSTSPTYSEESTEYCFESDANGN